MRRHGSVLFLAGACLCLWACADGAGDGSGTAGPVQSLAASVDAAALAPPGDAGPAPDVAHPRTPAADSGAVTADASEPAPAYGVGFSVTGLTGGRLVLQNNGADDVVLDGSGNYAFPTALPDGARYAVTVEAQPEGQQCVVQIGTGGGTIAGAAVSGVRVGCTTFANGSFEDAFAGWTLTRTSADASYGGMAVVHAGTVFKPLDVITDTSSSKDFILNEQFDYENLPLTLTGLPNGGNELAAFIAANGPTHNVASQVLTLAAEVTSLDFAVQYSSTSVLGPAQSVRVSLRDPVSDDLVAVLFETIDGDSLIAPAKTITSDVSHFVGKPVRLVLDATGGQGPLYVGFDAFTLR